MNPKRRQIVAKQKRQRIIQPTKERTATTPVVPSETQSQSREPVVTPPTVVGKTKQPAVSAKRSAKATGGRANQKSAASAKSLGFHSSEF